MGKTDIIEVVRTDSNNEAERCSKYICKSKYTRDQKLISHMEINWIYLVWLGGTLETSRGGKYRLPQHFFLLWVVSFVKTSYLKNLKIKINLGPNLTLFKIGIQQYFSHFYTDSLLGRFTPIFYFNCECVFFVFFVSQKKILDF